MGNTIFSEVDTVSDDYDDIEKPISKQTVINHIW